MVLTESWLHKDHTGQHALARGLLMCMSGQRGLFRKEELFVFMSEISSVKNPQTLCDLDLEVLCLTE